MFKELKMRLASNKFISKFMKGYPTSRYITDPLGKATGNRTVIPADPTLQQLRNLSVNPIVSRPIIAVQDRISMLDYEIRVKQGQQKYVRQIKTIRNIIDNPNIEHSRRQFESMLLQDLLVLDVGCFEAVKTNDPLHPIYLYPIDGMTIKPVAPIDYTDVNAIKYVQQVPSENVYFTRQELCYMRRNCFTNTSYGMSPVRRAYDFIRYLLDGCENAVDNMDNRTASMMIDLGESATPKQLEDFREYFVNEIEGTPRIPIVGGSRGVNTYQLKSLGGEVVYLDWLNWLGSIVSLSFPFPVQKMNIMRSTDRSTANDMEQIITEELVKPYARLLEDAYNKYVIGSLGLGDVLEFRYIFEETEHTKKLKTTRLNSAFKVGVITENEWRKEMGFPPSDSKYADYTSDERKALINRDLGINGFNGIGQVKDTSTSKDDKGGEIKDAEE